MNRGRAEKDQQRKESGPSSRVRGSKRSPQSIRFDTDLESGCCKSDSAVGDLLSGRSRREQWCDEAVVGDLEGIENLVERKEEKMS